ncbi:hypothetical protein [Streptosporangium canum]|uniref:hypothetical protein n=1 Tax=Streptosporangium canum TaxID=324952 RepID=UPI00378AE865
MLINLTQHPIRIYRPETPDRISDLSEGLLAVIPPTGTEARLAVSPAPASTVTVDGHRIPLRPSTYGAAVNLPDPQPGVLYLISLPLALELRSSGREDLLTTDRLVRNMEGTFIGCRGFGRAIGPAAIAAPDMPRRLAVADLTAMDLLQQAVHRLTGQRVSSADLDRVLGDAYPDAGRIHDDHLLVLMALSGQAANLLLVMAEQAGMDPLTLLGRLCEQTAAEAADLMGGQHG